MDDDFECDECYEETLTRKFRPIDLGVLALNLVAGISRSFTETFELAQVLVASHANHEIAREAFHEEAALELEALIHGETENG